jgi:CelD/BcsL family acetyltransferase involved in cellulose biosynthesis
LSHASSPGAGLRAEVVTARRAPEELVARWHELAVAAENPFALPAWQADWLATHPGDAPFVIVCREPSGEVAGVVPLVLRGRRLLAAGGQLVDWFGPACAPEDEARVAAAAVEALARNAQRWDVWELDRCKTDAGWLAGLQRATAGSAVKLLPHEGDDVLVAVDLERDGPDLTTSKKRRELARLSRRLAEAHEVVQHRTATDEQMEHKLAALLSLREERWGKSFDAGEEAFVRAFTASLARLDLLRFWATDVDGEPAGVLLGWRLGTRAFAYSCAFDRAHERFGVGIGLLAFCLRDAADEGCTQFDMLRGNEHFKGSFHIEPTPVCSFRAVRRRSLARLEAEARVGARSAYRRLSPEQREKLRRLLRSRRALSA